MTISDIEVLGIRTAGTSGSEILCHCPFHDDRNASASYNPQKKVLFCFSCKQGWSLDQLIEKLGTADMELMPNPFESSVARYEMLLAHQPENLATSISYEPDDDHIRYIESRGYDFDEFEEKVNANDDIGYWNSGFKGIAFLNKSPAGKVIGAHVRSCSDLPHIPRYSFHGQRAMLWPSFYAVGMASDIFIVEKAFGAANSLYRGIENVYSSLGSNISSELLSHKPISATFVFDNDKAGNAAADKMRAAGYTVFVTDMELDEEDGERVERELKLARIKSRIIDFNVNSPYIFGTGETGLKGPDPRILPGKLRTVDTNSNPWTGYRSSSVSLGMEGYKWDSIDTSS